MFFLHALFLFFLLGTPSSMAAVLPRSAGGYGNLRTRDVPSDPGYRPVGLDLHTRDLPAYKLLKGYWLLEGDGDLTLIHFNTEGKFDWLLYRVIPFLEDKDHPKQHSKQADVGVYNRITEKSKLDDIFEGLVKVPKHPEFTLPSAHHYSTWLKIEKSAGVMNIGFCEGRYKQPASSFKYEAVGEPTVEKGIAKVLHASVPTGYEFSKSRQ